MNAKQSQLSRPSVALLSLVLGVEETVIAAHAIAQESAPVVATAPIDTVIVIGKRASIASALASKRDQLGIVDSIVAEDLIELPDFSVTDALQRVTGVQITRDRGEGSVATLRGLTQMETTLNGREVFTAGAGRTLDFASIASEMVARIDVHKSASAAQLEGGMGGTIDLRTRQPFDFERNELLGSARLVHGDLAGATRGQYSVLASGRRRLDHAGELGALLNVSYQERSWREDQKSAGNRVARNDLVPGRAVTVANGTSETVSSGDRERTSAAGAFQWRPSRGAEIYLEGSHAELRTFQQSHQINVLPSLTFEPGSIELFPQTSDVRRITWTDAPISVLSFARDTVDRTRQLAVGSRFERGRWTVAADLSYTRSFSSLYFCGPFLAASGASFTHDLSTRVPSSSISGTDLLDPASFRYATVAYRTRPFRGQLDAIRLDADYEPAASIVRSVSAGMRYAARDATNAPGLIFADAAVVGIGAAHRPELVMANPQSDFFVGEGSSIRHFLVGDLGSARDAPALRRQLGIVAPLPTAADPTSVWDVEEDTVAAYGMLELRALRGALEGNVGLRAVRTRETLSSARSIAAGQVVPVRTENTYTDYLPSLNLRLELADDTYLRVAASRTITRPNFDQLSPSLVLVRNPIQPSLNQGSAGNPELDPVRADNLDLALERYFAEATAVHVTAYLKRVRGFVVSVSSPEAHDGVTYQVSRPQNATAAEIRGFELGYQHFFDASSRGPRGLGMQLNYTYVDSRTEDALLGSVPLPNLSRHSYNAILMYERRGFGARLAYNWRDRFPSRIVNVVQIGSLPVYTAAYGWLDASASYRFDDRTLLSIEGVNLLGTLRESYYGVPSRPDSRWLNDRQVSLTATLRF